MRPERFRVLYDAHFDSLLAFALRRSPSAEDAADAVSETFLTAWRRWDDVPEVDARLWLFGVARRVMANRRRGDLRRDRLGQRLRSDLVAAVPDHAQRVASTTDVMRGLRRLGESDREVLELSLWEGLEPREIARVLGIGEGAARTRLSRAKQRLRSELGDDRVGTGQVPVKAESERIPS